MGGDLKIVGIWGVLGAPPLLCTVATKVCSHSDRGLAADVRDFRLSLGAAVSA